MKGSKNNTVLLTVIGIATLLVAVVGATFAYFSAIVSGREEASTMVIKATNGGSSTFEGGEAIIVENIYPRTEAWVNKKIKISHDAPEGQGTYKYTIGMHVSNGFDADDLKYTVTEGVCEGQLEATNSASCTTGTWLTNTVGTVTKTTNAQTSLPTGTNDIANVATGEFNRPINQGAHYYTLRIYYVDKATVQTQNNSMSAYITTAEVQ